MFLQFVETLLTLSNVILNEKENYINCGSWGRAFLTVTPAEWGSANCNISSHVCSPFSILMRQAGSMRCSLAELSCVSFFDAHPHTLHHTHTQSYEELLRGLGVLSAVIFIKSWLLLPVSRSLNFNSWPLPECFTGGLDGRHRHYTAKAPGCYSHFFEFYGHFKSIKSKQSTSVPDFRFKLQQLEFK